MELFKYFATFYGDLTNVREDVASLSEINPRCVETGNIIMVSFNSALKTNEIKEFLNVGDRLFILQKLDKNLIINMPDRIVTHLMNNDPDYMESSDLTLTGGVTTEMSKSIHRGITQVHPDDIELIDDVTKKEIIDSLLERYSELSEYEKEVLRKLTRKDGE